MNARQKAAIRNPIGRAMDVVGRLELHQDVVWRGIACSTIVSVNR